MISTRYSELQSLEGGDLDLTLEQVVPPIRRSLSCIIIKNCTFHYYLCCLGYVNTSSHKKRCTQSYSGKS